MAVDQAAEELDGLIQTFDLLRDERAIFERWQRLVIEHLVTGKLAHDARLVAAMLRHGVSHVLTFNLLDFRRFAEITALHPSDLSSMPAAD
jgi:predicted nucleic acid-binding protein